MKEVERPDLWKFHPCEADCLHCQNLVDACLYWNGEGACAFVDQRCHNLNDTKWREHNNICELGCLNCNGLRKQCMNNNDFDVCNTYFQYCSVNHNKKEMALFTMEARKQISRSNNLYTEIMKKAQLKKLTPEECNKLKQECNSGYRMNNMIACVHWIFECDTSFPRPTNKQPPDKVEEEGEKAPDQQPEAPCLAMP